MTNLINSLFIRLTMVREREEGQTMVEYGLILAFIAAVCVVAVTALGGRVTTLLDSITF